MLTARMCRRLVPNDADGVVRWVSALSDPEFLLAARWCATTDVDLLTVRAGKLEALLPLDVWPLFDSHRYRVLQHPRWAHPVPVTPKLVGLCAAVSAAVAACFVPLCPPGHDLGDDVGQQMLSGPFTELVDLVERVRQVPELLEVALGLADEFSSTGPALVDTAVLLLH